MRICVILMSSAWGAEFSIACGYAERYAVGGGFFFPDHLYALATTFNAPKEFLPDSIAITTNPFPAAARVGVCVVVWSLVKTLMRYD